VTVQLCLCSGSTTRARLLEQAGVAFVQEPVPFDEETLMHYDVASDYVYHVARGKLEAAERIHGLARPLLSADTVVVNAEGAIVRKAQDQDAAREMLLSFSGAHIAIITSLHYKRSDRYLTDTSQTLYRFEPFDREDLERYLASGAWQGKAGACMVEGFCQPYIRSVEGHESTAMGLQVEVLLPWL